MYVHTVYEKAVLSPNCFFFFGDIFELTLLIIGNLAKNLGELSIEVCLDVGNPHFVTMVYKVCWGFV